MKMYRISCFSRCGSYFEPYLKSVIVLADTKEQAIESTKMWMKETKNYFIYPIEKWMVSEPTELINNQVIDWDISSDY